MVGFQLLLFVNLGQRFGSSSLVYVSILVVNKQTQQVRYDLPQGEQALAAHVSATELRHITIRHRLCAQS
jgi:hypothetical protein